MIDSLLAQIAVSPDADEPRLASVATVATNHEAIAEAHLILGDDVNARGQLEARGEASATHC